MPLRPRIPPPPEFREPLHSSAVHPRYLVGPIIARHLSRNDFANLPLIIREEFSVKAEDLW